MIARLAHRSVGTAALVACWSANSIESFAHLVIGAILVVLAPDRRTNYPSVTLSSLWTRALGLVSHGPTLGPATAHDVVDQAWCYAHVVATSLVVGTVMVGFAIGWKSQTGFWIQFIPTFKAS